MVTPEGLISAAAIIIGFGVTVFLFRVQRELWVRDKHPEWPNWVSWSDYLALSSMVSALIFVIIPLVTFPNLPPLFKDIAAAACAASSVLLIGYIPAVLAHYRIEIGSNRVGPRGKGEPAERAWVIGIAVLATIIFLGIILLRQRVIP